LAAGSERNRGLEKNSSEFFDMREEGTLIVFQKVGKKLKNRVFYRAKYLSTDHKPVVEYDLTLS
jgi:hypothetical protein